MTKTREDFFAIVRAFAPDERISAEDFRMLDSIARRWRLVEEAKPSLKPSRACLELIKSFEGCRLTAYPDPGSGGDPWTIGWGSTGPGIRKGTVWTQEQADSRFAEHVAEFGEDAAAVIDSAPTSQNEFDALVSLAYNIGIGALRDSTLMRLHKAGDKAGVAEQFAKWVRASGKVLPGLVRRRKAEADLYLGRGA